MKRRTTPTLKVQINIDKDEVSTIIFLFKQIRDESAPVKLEKIYPKDVVYDSENKCYLIPFTEEDTALFEPQTEFYMDTKITTIDGKVPETDIVRMFMRDTLFDDNEE